MSEQSALEPTDQPVRGEQMAEDNGFADDARDEADGTPRSMTEDAPAGTESAS